MNNSNPWAQMALTGNVPPGLMLLQEDAPFVIVDRKNTINEDISNRVGDEIRVMKLTGVFQRADEKNANGRVYPFQVLGEAVDDMQDSITERRVMGEFDHPPDAKIHLDRVSHLITNLWMDGKVVYGEIEVINDDRCECGATLAALIDRGVNIGISSRGVGDMEITHLQEGEEAYEVQPGFHFVTFDVVAEPSVSGTQLRVSESVRRRKKHMKESIRRGSLVETREPSLSKRTAKRNRDLRKEIAVAKRRIQLENRKKKSAEKRFLFEFRRQLRN